MKLTNFCGGTKEFAHVLLLNLGDWEKELTLSLVKQKSMACISSNPVGFWHKK